MTQQLTISDRDLRWIKGALRRAHAYSRFGVDGAATGILSAVVDGLDDAVKPVCKTLGCGMPTFGEQGWCAACGADAEGDEQANDEDVRIARSEIDADLRGAQGPIW